MRVREIKLLVLTCHSICSREFTHRVKSVSMAKFTSQEVAALQEGGNKVKYPPPNLRVTLCLSILTVFCLILFSQRARDIYFKEWDSQRQSAPDSRLYLLIFVFHILKIIAVLICSFAASNVERLRDFIKHVYVDRRYTGERNYGKPPSMKMVRCPLFLPSFDFS